MTAELAGLREPFVAAIAELDPGRLNHIGLPDNARPPVIAALAQRHEGPTLVLVSSPARAQALTEELGLFVAGMPLARLSERERLPYELSRDDPSIAVERAHALALLRGDTRAIVVASWAAASEHCAGPEVAMAGLDVRAGATQEPGALVRELEERGYESTHLADRPGTLASRGGLVDVFPAGGIQPVRIEFFGNDVESIRVVDLGSQRSVLRLETVHFPPAATGTRTAREAARALAESVTATGDGAETVVEHLWLLAEGNRTGFEGFFEPLLYGTTALAHLTDAAQVLLDDAEEGEAALATLAEHESRTRVELAGRGTIPEGLPALRQDAASFARQLHECRTVRELQRFGSEELGAARLPLRVTPSFAGKLRPFAQQAGQWAKEGKSVVVASQQALRLAEILEGEGVSADLRRTLPAAPGEGSLTLVPVALGGGVILGEQLIVVSDSEIFGFRKKRRPLRTRAGVRSDLVSTLEVGDHLVHADHGISRYGGLLRKTVEGMEREYLELQYAEGDRIYVPADQLESVTRYVGPADHPPSLTRLGSQDWVRAKRRVRQAVVELAQELLELYARRELASGYAFTPAGAWQMEMEAAFPFVETPEQLEAITDVKADMERSRPMDRLICGDVGYGKTEVAIRAAFKAVADGKQVAVLVPTTVLAEQHGATFRERTAGFPVRVEVLSRFRSEAEQRAIVLAVSLGEVDIAIGTHRLLQRDVEFKDLGLVVIDEEQRFGVSHKERLKQMRAEVDTLTLSATPIPRTLQMSLAGIRDMSTIMTPPEERLPIRTYVLQWDDEIIREAIDREIQRGGQIYFVHNRVHNIERIVTRLRRLCRMLRSSSGMARCRRSSSNG